MSHCKHVSKGFRNAALDRREFILEIPWDAHFIHTIHPLRHSLFVIRDCRPSFPAIQIGLGEENGEYTIIFKDGVVPLETGG